MGKRGRGAIPAIKKTNGAIKKWKKDKREWMGFMRWYKKFGGFNVTFLLKGHA